MTQRPKPTPTQPTSTDAIDLRAVTAEQWLRARCSMRDADGPLHAAEWQRIIDRHLKRMGRAPVA